MCSRPKGSIRKDFTGDGIAVNSGLITGLPTPEAKKKITAWLEERGSARPRCNTSCATGCSRASATGASRSRSCIARSTARCRCRKSELPLMLPEMKDYTPTGNAEPPLAKATDWVNTTCPQCGGPAKRETNTMPQWAGSCWYYLRYLDPQNDGGVRREGQGEVLDARRSVCRRRGARGAAPALLAVLAQGAVRSRPRLARPSRSCGSSTRA